MYITDLTAATTTSSTTASTQWPPFPVPGLTKASTLPTSFPVETLRPMPNKNKNNTPPVGVVGAKPEEQKEKKEPQAESGKKKGASKRNTR
eukprot:265266-Rhodomonas_salina.1